MRVGKGRRSEWRSPHIPALFRALVAGLGAVSAFAGVAQGQSVEQFYTGRSIVLIVPYSPGGYYDVGARIIARHMGRHIPGKPGIVVQNQPTAGGIGLANRLANVGDKDGTQIGVLQRAIPQVALMGDPAVRYDPLKLTWFGSLSGYATDSYVLFVSKGHNAQTVADLRRGGLKAIMGANRAGSSNLMLALVARDVLGLNIDIVRGFPGANDITLAVQRGEVDGQLADLSVLKAGMGDLWSTGRVRVLVQFARVSRLPELGDVPTARELVTNAEDRALLEFAELPFFMSLPLAGSGDFPADRAKAVSVSIDHGQWPRSGRHHRNRGPTPGGFGKMKRVGEVHAMGETIERGRSLSGIVRRQEADDHVGINRRHAAPPPA